MADVNVKANVQRTSTLGKVRILVEQVVGSPSQAQISQAVADYIDSHPGALSPLSQATKSALLDIAAHVAYIDANGQSRYDALDAALNPPAGLVSITAVFEQGGATIYTTDSLDTLKPMLTVTANYDDGTTEEVTSYTLGGTLEEGTSTITVTYEGKTASFTVVVALYSTQPVIMTENVVWSKNMPNTVSATGFGITEWYDYSFSQEKLESSRYWDTTNGYMTLAGWAGIQVGTPDAKTYEAGHAWPSSANYKDVAGLDDVYRSNYSITRNAQFSMSFGRQSVNAVRNNCVSFSIPLADIDDCYAFWHSGVNDAIYPDGVFDGDIIFAGRNTQYFGCHNISEAPTVTSIEVTFTQGDHAVAASDALYTLKPYMDVVATFSDGSVRHPNLGMVALSGTLVSGTTSTITATYEGATDTFDVVVS